MIPDFAKQANEITLYWYDRLEGVNQGETTIEELDKLYWTLLDTLIADNLQAAYNAGKSAQALRDSSENTRLRDALETAMHWGIELGTTDPRWVAIARAALTSDAQEQK